MVIQNADNMIKIKFKKLSDKAVIPSYAKPGDAGMDLTATSIKSKSWFKITYGLGFATEIPEGCYSRVVARSSIHKTFMWLCNSVGVIDSQYRGEWMAVFYKIPFISKPYKVGDRICQMIPERLEKTKVIETKVLSETERGAGGFGSTGV